MNDILTRSRKKLVRASGGTRAFFEKYSWLLVDFVSTTWPHALLVVVLAGVSAALNVAIVSNFVGVLRKLARTGEAGIASVDLPVIGAVGPTTLGVGLGVVLAGAATLDYLYRRSAFAAARAYQAGATTRAAVLMPELPNLYRPLRMSAPEANAYLQAIIRHGRLYMIFMLIILFSALESLIAVGCFIALIFVDPVKTAAIALLLLAAVPGFYFLSLRGLRNREKMPLAFTALRDELKIAEDDLRQPGVGGISAQKEKITAVFSGETAEAAFVAFRNQRLVVHQSGYAASVLAALVLAMSVVLFLKTGDGAARDDTLGIYFALLLVMGNAMVRSLRSIVSSNRFFKTLTFHYDLLGPGSRKPPAKECSPGTEMTYSRRSGELVELRSDTAVYLYFPGNVTRLDWVGVVNRLSPCNEQPERNSGDLVIVSGSQKPSPGPELEGKLIFVENNELSSDGSIAGPDGMSGAGPRFTIIDKPLERPPAATSDWVYIWGHGENVLGDATNSQTADFPSPEKLQRELAKLMNARKTTADQDLDEELY